MIQTGIPRSTYPWRVDRRNANENSWGLRVVLLHSFYREDTPSGENKAVRSQFQNLAKAGVNVTLLSVHTDDIMHQIGYGFRAASNVALGSGLDPSNLLAALRPDVVHVHNLFPNIATSWIRSCDSAVVATLHNYRPLCAAGTLSRNGRDCALCLEKSTIHSIKHRCYRNSYLATTPLAFRNRRGPVHDAVLSGADLLLVPSETMRQTYASWGISRLEVIRQPADESTQDVQIEGVGSLFTGRLAKEKGILELINSWPLNKRLTVCGVGPVEAQARRAAAGRGIDVDFRGFVSGQEMVNIMASADSLVVPSTWREGAPLVYAEALSVGTPLIALAGSAVANSVNQDRTGVVIDDLSTHALLGALDYVSGGARHEIAQNARATFHREYTSVAWIRKIRQAYHDATSKKALASNNQQPED